MTVLVVGASGATGRLLVEELLGRGLRVRAVVRSLERLPEHLRANGSLEIVHASLLDLDEDALVHLVRDCTAIASCLGHNMTLKGIYGAPRRLVTEATRRLCDAVRTHSGDPSRSTRGEPPARFVLMNTTGNRNRDLNERVSFAERFVVGAIRLLLPPHADNEDAAEYLRVQIGQGDETIEWIAVRPDTLVDDAEAVAYEVHPSPTRSAIFDAGRTNRSNVAHFMAELATDDDTWRRWRGQMPVLYDKGPS